jgi:hypothetical protein
MNAFVDVGTISQARIMGNLETGLINEAEATQLETRRKMAMRKRVDAASGVDDLFQLMTNQKELHELDRKGVRKAADQLCRTLFVEGESVPAFAHIGLSDLNMENVDPVSAGSLTSKFMSGLQNNPDLTPDTLLTAINDGLTSSDTEQIARSAFMLDALLDSTGGIWPSRLSLGPEATQLYYDTMANVATSPGAPASLRRTPRQAATDALNTQEKLAGLKPEEREARLKATRAAIKTPEVQGQIISAMEAKTAIGSVGSVLKSLVPGGRRPGHELAQFAENVRNEQATIGPWFDRFFTGQTGYMEDAVRGTGHPYERPGFVEELDRNTRFLLGAAMDPLILWRDDPDNPLQRMESSDPDTRRQRIQAAELQASFANYGRGVGGERTVGSEESPEMPAAMVTEINDRILAYVRAGMKMPDAVNAATDVAMTEWGLDIMNESYETRWQKHPLYRYGDFPEAGSPVAANQQIWAAAFLTLQSELSPEDFNNLGAKDVTINQNVYPPFDSYGNRRVQIEYTTYIDGKPFRTPLLMTMNEGLKYWKPNYHKDSPEGRAKALTKGIERQARIDRLDADLSTGQVVSSGLGNIPQVPYQVSDSIEEAVSATTRAGTAETVGFDPERAGAYEALNNPLYAKLFMENLQFQFPTETDKRSRGRNEKMLRLASEGQYKQLDEELAKHDLSIEKLLGPVLLARTPLIRKPNAP